jgi:hypothetical protein
MTTKLALPRRRPLLLLFLAVAASRGASPAVAQESPASTLPATVDEALLAMAARAGVIFSGTIVAIDHQDESGYVDIRFHIDEAVRNCPQTGFYVLREWSGLWAGGLVRYRVGDRRLMLLHDRGPSGLSSPVNGLDGAIPLVADAIPPLTRGTASAPADTASPEDPRPDLRWVAAGVQRTSTGEVVSATTVKPHATATEPNWFGPVAPIPSSTAPPLRSVMALLHGASSISPKPTASPDARSREGH